GARRARAGRMYPSGVRRHWRRRGGAHGQARGAGRLQRTDRAAAGPGGPVRVLDGRGPCGLEGWLMPAAVIGAIGTAAGWTAATIATVTAVTQVVLFVGGLALSAHQRSQAKKKATEQYNAAQVDRLANVVT